MSLAELKFKLSTDVGDPTKLWAEIVALGPHGAIGADGVSVAWGFPKGVFDTDGNLKLRAANGTLIPYPINPADFVGAEYQISVKRGATTVGEAIRFEPVAANGIVDVLNLLKQGRAQYATPEQLLSLSGLLTTGQQRQTDYDTVQKPAIQQAIGSTENAIAAALNVAGAVQFPNIATLKAYSGPATSAVIGQGTGAGYSRNWVRDDSATLRPGYVEQGANGARWRRVADPGRVEASWVLTPRSIALADGKTAARDANLTDPTGAGITAAQTELSSLVVNTLQNNSTLNLSGMGEVYLKSMVTKGGLTNATIIGTGTTLRTAAANTNSLYFTNGSNIKLTDVVAEGQGNEWDNTKRNGSRFINTSGGADFTVQNAVLSRFSQAAISHYNISRTRTIDSNIIGLGFFDPVTNPRGIVSGLMPPNYATDQGIVIPPQKTELGNYSFGMNLDPTANGPDHWVSRNYFTLSAMGLLGGNGLTRLSAVDNVFDTMTGQHATYLAGTRQLTYALNRHYNGTYDGLKNQNNSASPWDSEANVVMGNSFMAFRGTSWAVNFGTVSGTKRHKASLITSNVVYDTKSGGISQRNADHGMVTGNLLNGLGSYGLFTQDFSGTLSNNYIQGTDLTGVYAGVKTGERVSLTNMHIDDYVRTGVLSGEGGEPGGATTLAGYASLTGVCLSGAGKIRLSQVRVGNTFNKALYGFYSDASTVLEYDGTNRGPDNLPNLLLGPVDEINGDHMGPILRADNSIYAPLYNWADGTLRRGRGAGRVFNRSGIPTTGSWRVQDTIFNTAPNTTPTMGWVCTTPGTLGKPTPAALNMTTTSGSGIVAIDRIPTDIAVGDWITIPGAVTSAMVARIETVYANNDPKMLQPLGYNLRLTASATASGTFTDLQFVPPVFSAWGNLSRGSMTYTWDAPSIPAGGTVTQTVTFPGAVIGDFLQFSVQAGYLPSVVAQAHITAANTITLSLYNSGTAAHDPPARTWNLRVQPYI